MQALQALKRLHENIGAERRVLLELQRAWFAIITPHQLMRGELAAWPGSVYPMRMIKYLGALARRSPLDPVHCAACNRVIAGGMLCSISLGYVWLGHAARPAGRPKVADR